VDIGELLAAVNAELGGRWRLERGLAGGWNEGAYLLIGSGGSRTVLNWLARDPERLFGARKLVETARALGWPAPKWLATAHAPNGPRAYDLAEASLVGAGHGQFTGSAAARLCAYAAELDRRDFAICAGWSA
jgi:hypothetical protein